MNKKEFLIFKNTYNDFIDFAINWLATKFNISDTAAVKYKIDSLIFNDDGVVLNYWYSDKPEDPHMIAKSELILKIEDMID
jgi:hypothetical protein